MTDHVLKAHPDSFDLLALRQSEVQLRKNDRNFKVGDICTFYEYMPDKKCFTGHSTVEMPIVAILEHHEGLTPNWCLIVINVPMSNITTFNATLAGKETL